MPTEISGNPATQKPTVFTSIQDPSIPANALPAPANCNESPGPSLKQETGPSPPPVPSADQNQKNAGNSDNLNSRAQPPAKQEAEVQIKKETHYYMLDPKVTTPVNITRKLYNASTTPVIAPPYSHSAIWENYIKKLLDIDSETFMWNILSLPNRNWCQELIKISNEATSSKSHHFLNYAINKNFQRLQEHFNWLTWCIAKFYFETHKVEMDPKEIKLPKADTKEWEGGFLWKGLNIHVYTSNEASLVKEEMKAIQSLNLELSIFYNEIKGSFRKTGAESERMAGMENESSANVFLRNLVFPLISTAECRGELLVVSLSFYVSSESISESNAIATSPLLASANPKGEENDSIMFELGALKSLPMLGKLTSKNLLPFIDPEKIGSSDAPLKYAIINASALLPSVQPSSGIFFKIPARRDMDIEMLYTIQATKFEASTLVSLVGCEPLMQYSKEPQAQELDRMFVAHSERCYTSLFGWDIQMLWFKNLPGDTLENERVNSLLSAQSVNSDPPSDLEKPEKKAIGSTLLACHYFKGDSKMKYPILCSLQDINSEAAIYSALSKAICLAAEDIAQQSYINSQYLKFTLHKRGLNMRFLWPVLSMLSNPQAVAVVEIEILLRAIKKLVFNKVGDKEDTINAKIVRFKESLTNYLNVILKQNALKSQAIFEQVFQVLFLSRLRILNATLNHIFPNDIHKSYLQSRDIIQGVFQSGRKNPRLLLETAQKLFKIQFDPELMRKARADKFSFLKTRNPIEPSQIFVLEIKITAPVSIRTHSYMVLMKLIYDENLEEQKRAMENASLETLKKGYSKYPTLNSGGKAGGEGGAMKTELGNSAENYKTTRDKLPNKQIFPGVSQYQGKDQSQPPVASIDPTTNIKTVQAIHLSRIQAQPQSTSKGATVKLPKHILMDTKENLALNSLDFENANSSPLIKNNASQTYIRPLDSQPMIIAFPENLYAAFDSTTFIKEETIAASHLCKPSYEFPKIEILEEWHHYNQMMLADLHGIDGSEGIVIESLYCMILHHLYKEKNSDKALRALQTLRELLNNAYTLHPELLLSALTLSALTLEITVSYSEAESLYLLCMLLFFLLYGDPRGRGNLVPLWGLVIGGRLKKLATSQRRLMDSEYMDEILEAIATRISCEEIAKEPTELKEVRISILQPEGSPHQDQAGTANKDLGEDDGLEEEEEEKEWEKLSKEVEYYIETASSPDILVSSEWLGLLLKFSPITHLSGSLYFCNTIKEILCMSKGGAINSDKKPGLPSNAGVAAASNPFLGSQNVVPSQSILSTPSSSYKEKKTPISGGHVGYWEVFTRDYHALPKADMKGVLYSWGADCSGQLGHSYGKCGEGKKANYPRLCAPLKDLIIRDMACGDSSTFAITASGAVFSWGRNEYGQLGLGSRAGKVVLHPRMIKGLPQDVIKIVSGHEHAVALCKSSEVYSWGHGESGLLGHGEVTSYARPKRVEFLNDKKVISISSGGLHTFALTKEGKLFGWGCAEGGQLGFPEKYLEEIHASLGDYYISLPKELVSLQGESICQVSCGEAHTLALANTGVVYGWGFSNYGQLGLGYTSDSFEPGTGNYRSKCSEPTKIVALADNKIIRVVAGSTFSLFISDKGELYACGMNDIGQIGTELAYRELPVSYMGSKQFIQTTDVCLPMPVLCFSGIRM